MTVVYTARCSIYIQTPRLLVRDFVRRLYSRAASIAAARYSHAHLLSTPQVALNLSDFPIAYILRASAIDDDDDHSTAPYGMIQTKQIRRGYSNCYTNLLKYWP